MKTIRIALVTLAVATSGVVAAGGVHDAVLTITALIHSPVTVFNPQSYNLGDCPDNGVLNVQVDNTQDGFDVTTIRGIDPETGAVDPNLAPVLIPWNQADSTNDPEGGGVVRGTPIDSASFVQDAEGNTIGVKMFYKTCLPSDLGFTQIVQDLSLVDNGTVDVTVSGTQAGVGASPDTPFSATDYNHKVVKIGG